MKLDAVDICRERCDLRRRSVTRTRDQAEYTEQSRAQRDADDGYDF